VESRHPPCSDVVRLREPLPELRHEESQVATGARNVNEGDYLEAEIVKGGVLLKPVAVVDRKDAWKSVMRAVSSVRDTKPKGKRNAKATFELLQFPSERRCRLVLSEPILSEAEDVLLTR
jgi:hypothetical protein